MNVLCLLQLQFLHLQLFLLKCIYLLMIIGSDAKIGSMAQVPWRTRTEEWSQPFNFRLHWVIKVDCLKILIRPQSLLLFKLGHIYHMLSRSHYSEQYVTHINHLMKEPNIFLSSLLNKDSAVKKPCQHREPILQPFNLSSTLSAHLLPA